MKQTQRFEFKYVISYKDYFRIRELINGMLIHDKHGEENEYQVYSIYLDDIVFSGATDKAFGNEVHKKYRIRFYNNEEVMKLELKTKVGDLSTKYSTIISNKLYQAILTQDIDQLELHKDDELIRRFLLDTMRFNLKPIISIKYGREAFKDEIDNVRITFDHYLVGSLFDDELTDPDVKLLNDNKLIMEVKYEYLLPKELKRIINIIKPNQIAFSKYFLGFNSLGL